MSIKLNGKIVHHEGEAEAYCVVTWRPDFTATELADFLTALSSQLAKVMQGKKQ